MTILAAAPVMAGDEDEKPSYLIYIDPETGKYTTTDPGVEDAQGSDVAETGTIESNAQAAGQNTVAGHKTALIAGSMAIVLAVLAGSRLIFRRSKTDT